MSLSFGPNPPFRTRLASVPQPDWLNALNNLHPSLNRNIQAQLLRAPSLFINRRHDRTAPHSFDLAPDRGACLPHRGLMLFCVHLKLSTCRIPKLFPGFALCPRKWGQKVTEFKTGMRCNISPAQHCNWVRYCCCLLKSRACVRSWFWRNWVENCCSHSRGKEAQAQMLRLSAIFEDKSLALGHYNERTGPNSQVSIVWWKYWYKVASF